MLRWRVTEGGDWVRDWLYGTVVDGKRVRGVADCRGKAAADRLREDCRDQWAKGNRGEPGDWR